MITSIAGFIKEYEEEAKGTSKLLNTLTDDSLNQQVWTEGRNLGRLGWHIVQSIVEMGDKAGIPIEGPSEEEPVPVSANIISDKYQKATGVILNSVKNWNDSNLNDIINAYGMSFSKGEMLDMVVKHEIHHRAQMTVLMRQAGLPVHGVYGPSKEEWVTFGMEPKD